MPGEESKIAELEKKIDETTAWLDSNQQATKDEYETQKKELEESANPIMMEFYQKSGGAGAGGAPGGFPGGPGGFPGGAPGAGGASEDGPSVEEVD